MAIPFKSPSGLVPSAVEQQVGMTWVSKNLDQFLELFVTQAPYWPRSSCAVEWSLVGAADIYFMLWSLQGGGSTLETLPVKIPKM